MKALIKWFKEIFATVPAYQQDPKQILWDQVEQTVNFARTSELDEHKIRHINKAIDQLMALKRKYQN